VVWITFSSFVGTVGRNQDVSLISPEVQNGNLIKSRVIEDIFHVMNRIIKWIPKKHGLAKEFTYSFRDAIFVLDESDMATVKTYLRSIGQSIEEYIKYKYDWVTQRVRRYVPLPQELLQRVSQVFEFYEDKLDDNLGIPLFNSRAKKEAAGILSTISNGLLSDIPGMSLYFFVRYDKNRLPLYRCVRGTNSCESMHSNIYFNMNINFLKMMMIQCLFKPLGCPPLGFSLP
jgi:hypothetical protein